MFIREEQNPKRITQINSAGCLMWRGVFRCAFKGVEGNRLQNLRLLPLGSQGWAQIVQENPNLRNAGIPYRVALTLPAVFDDQGVVSVPHLNYHRHLKHKSLSPYKITFVNATFVPLDQR